ncbi:unnamed protein product [Blumeria hordei]|uniref:Uncharacterized protein n=1 Tax=Blumeria hordei TaxID=2867405 RepID=A0A383V2E9_BLUHO|nr:unnamed protein product [Blumeria hordei]
MSIRARCLHCKRELHHGLIGHGPRLISGEKSRLATALIFMTFNTHCADKSTAWVREVESKPKDSDDRANYEILMLI